VARDRSFCFYYPENIEALEAAGARIRYFRPTEGDRLPDCDALYLGGGYPEVHAADLSANGDFLEGVLKMSLEGKLVLGECGGLMALCRSIRAFGAEHRMAGLFPSDAVLTPDRQGLAYVQATATGDNFLFPAGRSGRTSSSTPASTPFLPGRTATRSRGAPAWAVARTECWSAAPSGRTCTSTPSQAPRGGRRSSGRPAPP
jgi:cobyrinic acid a,c-diamide synthase